MKQTIFIALLLLLLPAASGRSQQSSAADDKPQTSTDTTVASENETPGVPDTSLGLAKGSVFDVAAPPLAEENGSEPGEEPPFVRPTGEWPPAIPHSIADFLPITRTENLCIDCHQIDQKEEGEPTPIPRSHFIDLHQAPDEAQEAVSGARWVCVSCHVSQTKADPLVGNSAHDVVEAEADSTEH